MKIDLDNDPIMKCFYDDLIDILVAESGLAGLEFHGFIEWLEHNYGVKLTFADTEDITLVAMEIDDDQYTYLMLRFLK